MPRKKSPEVGDDSQTSFPGMDTKEDGRARPRVTIPLAEDGSLNIEGMKEQSRQRLIDALKTNPHSFEGMGAPASVASEMAIEGPITADHINFLLTGYEFLERWAIPPLIEKQNPGLRIPRPLVDSTFVFTPQHREKLIPCGIKFFNANLPDWLLKWIARTGPGSEFFGTLVLITYLQVEGLKGALKELQHPPVTVEGVRVDGQAAEPAIPVTQ